MSDNDTNLNMTDEQFRREMDDLEKEFGTFDSYDNNNEDNEFINQLEEHYNSSNNSLYDPLLDKKYLSIMEHTEKISNALSGRTSEKDKKYARNRNSLIKINGIIKENERPCFSPCKQKSMCEGGLCDWKYYCLESNKHGDDVMEGIRPQECIPAETKKTKGGNKKKKRKTKKRKTKKCN